MPQFRGHRASHSRSTSSPSGLGYDVFLSFRGEDTRKNFTDHLYTALLNAHFRTFRDDPELERGENIKEKLENAIRQSWSSVIVFSKDYTSSRWCLDELVLILERKRTSKHVVLPVFYDVMPSDLRKIKEEKLGSGHSDGVLAKAGLNKKNKKKQSPVKLSRWKEALKEVADLAGMVLKNEADGHESKFIQKIVTVIQEKLDQMVDSLSATADREIQKKLYHLGDSLSATADREIQKKIYHLGDSLSATAGHNSSLLSSSGDFAFGFRQLENSENFLLSIWFAKIPDRTIVWYANGDRPAPKGSIVKLTSSSGLVLTTPQDEQLWKSDLTIAGVVAYGYMNDNGNFILEDKKSEKLWETFKNPTDTMLPGQIIERGGRLSSRQSETNYARGRFLIDFQEDGNLVFSAKKPFHSTKTTTETVAGSEGKQLVFDDSGDFYILRVNGGRFTFTAEKRPARDYYLRSTLNFDGVLVQYFLPKSSVDTVSWKPLWSEPDNTSKRTRAMPRGSFLSILIFLCSVLSFWFRKTTKMCLDEKGDFLLGRGGRLSSGKPKLTVTNWKKGDYLGSGSFGSVYKGITDGGCFIAVKEVPLLDQGRVSQLEQEIALLSQFEHENIVQYYGTQKDESKLYIFLELVTEGSLRKQYQTYPLTDSHVSVYTRQILQGLKYLHDQNVIHRDIKCANILVHANGSVNLADFGLAKAIKMNDIMSRKGTARWMAPEVVHPENPGYGLPADIWSLGCTVLEMLTRDVPYPNLEWMAAACKIMMGELPLVPDSLSREAQDFIHRCLQVKPDNRPTAAQLLEHPFVNKPLPPTSSESVSPYNHHRQS